ncbi:MAG: exodeoxyribonuclease III [Parvularculaceae bacterium]
MKIATFNVNSINARLPRIIGWFDRAKPDVCVMQEIKCIDEKFPAAEFEDRGYNVCVHGQKTYNGVALLSKFPIDEAVKGLPGDDEDDHARYIEALIMPNCVEPVRIIGIYAPNGNPAPGPKYDYKLKWMKRLERHIRKLLKNEEALIVAGDWNIIPQAEDVYTPKDWADDALFRPESRAIFREIANLGLTDALRHIHPTKTLYTFWDYQRGAWDKDHGIRIDHMMLSPQAADRLKNADVDRAERGPGRSDVKPSDHVPVWIELK